MPPRNDKWKQLDPRTSLFTMIWRLKLREDVQFYCKLFGGTQIDVLTRTPQEFYGQVAETRSAKREFDRRPLDKLNEAGKNFAAECGVDLKFDYTAEDFIKIAAKLGDAYKLHVFHVDNVTKRATLVWAGEEGVTEKNIAVMRVGSVYAITDVHVLPHRYYCFYCNEGARSEHDHRCKHRCHRCNGIATLCNDDGSEVECDECLFTFKSLGCYIRHLNPSSGRSNSRCQSLRACPKCCAMVNTSHGRHVCGTNSWCSRCCAYVERGLYQPGVGGETAGVHQCQWYIPSDKTLAAKQRLQQEFCFLFYDIEAIVTKAEGELSSGDVVEHVPNVICTRQVCHECIGDYTTLDKPCRICVREKTFSYQDFRDENGAYVNTNGPMDAFCEFLLKHPSCRNRVIFAHNGGRYDNIMVVAAMTQRHDVYPKLVMRGCTIIQCSIAPTRPSVGGHVRNNIVFKDTYALMPVGLGQFTKAFELPANIDKGTFPFYYNRPENYGTVRSGLPPIEYYDPRSKKPESAAQLIAWHSAQGDAPFDFDKEIIDYCKADVQVLLLGALAYRKALMDLAGWDPLKWVNTAAAYSSLLFRFNHLVQGKIYHVPENGYYNARLQSDLAIKWLTWIEKTRGIVIRHTFSSGGEKKLELGDKSTHCDGYAELPDGTAAVFEVHGCYWHGCPRCYRPDQKNPTNNARFQDLYERTMARGKMIASRYAYEAIWECDIRRQLSEDDEMKSHFETVKIPPRLKAREGQQGGRTEKFANYAKATDEMDICYKDVCSLYPACQYFESFPIGTPRVRRGDFTQEDCRNYSTKGLVLLKILPPRQMLRPVLGVRAGDFLCFSLCKTCAETRNQDECRHTDDERAITGTYTHVEILEAVRRDYTIMEIYETWEYDSWSSDLFKSFIASLIVKKVEASGWPSWVKSEEDKDNYIRTYKERMNVNLNKDNIRKNPALRFASKIMLNSSWGKLGQRPGDHHTEYKSAEEYWQLLEDSTYKLTSKRRMNEDVYLVRYCNITKEMTESPPYTNSVLGCYVTAYARLRLYKLLEIAGDRALYCDTDSVMYLQPRNEPDIFEEYTGDFLGDLTSEVPDGQRIVEFVSAGPKQYALRFADAVTGEIVEEVLKVRGMTLDVNACEKLTFDTFRDMVLSRDGRVISITRQQMKRSLTRGLVSASETKRYKTVNHKSVTKPDGSIVPYGF